MTTMQEKIKKERVTMQERGNKFINKKIISKQSMTTANGQKVVNVRVTDIHLPLWQKTLLTLEEASEFTGVGQSKLKQISNNEKCEFVLWNNSKRMFKREKLVKFLEEQYSI